MRLFGNAIQQFYGQLIITAAPGGSGLVVNGNGSSRAASFQAGAFNFVVGFDSTNASGPFIEFTRSGTAFAFLGNSGALGGSLLDNLGVRGELGIDFIVNAGTHIGATMTSGGNLTINAATSGFTLTAVAAQDLGGIQISGAQNNIGLTLNNSQTGGTANWRIQSSATGSAFGAGNLVIGVSSSQFITVTPGGVVSVNAPSSGATLTLSSGTGSQGLVLQGADIAAGLFNAASSASRSLLNFAQASVTTGRIGIDGSNILLTDSANGDMCIIGGTTPIRMGQFGGATQLQLAVNGGLVCGAATGGSKGAGTGNFTGLFVNGASVSGGGAVIGIMAITFNGGSAPSISYSKNLGATPSVTRSAIGTYAINHNMNLTNYVMSGVINNGGAAVFIPEMSVASANSINLTTFSSGVGNADPANTYVLYVMITTG